MIDDEIYITTGIYWVGNRRTLRICYNYLATTPVSHLY
jgi:hypothetical protein